MKQNIVATIIALTVLSAGAQIKVACIGNSITQGVGVSDPSTQAYPAVLQNLLGNGYSVQNDGVSGTTLLKNGDNSYWKNGKLASVFAFSPNIVTIKLGTNDTKPQNWDAYNTQFRRDYEAMIDTLNTLSTKPKIFLVLPVPIWTNTFGIRDSALQKMIPIIKDIGAKRGLWIIDANTPLKNFSSYFSDGVHPNASGADTIASVIYHSIIGNPSSFRFVARSHTSAQGTLPYRLFYPYKYDQTKKYPLIITLHGVGESGTDNWFHITKNRLAEIWADDTTQVKQNCFVVSPQCPTNHKWVEVSAWNVMYYSTQSIAQSIPLTITLTLVDSLKREFPIDTNRLYVVGLSMGGYGTWDLIARYPGKFAAAVPLCGGNDTSKASALQNVPIWAFHGALDPTVPPNADRSMMRTIFPNIGLSVTYYTTQYTSYFAASTITSAALSSAINGGAKKLYCEYTDGVHDIWAKTYNEPLLAQWLFLQQKGATVGVAKSRLVKTTVKNTRNVHKVMGGNDVPSIFSTLAPGRWYSLRVFNARGVQMQKAVIDASASSKIAVQKMVEATPGVKWVQIW